MKKQQNQRFEQGTLYILIEEFSLISDVGTWLYRENSGLIFQDMKIKQSERYVMKKGRILTAAIGMLFIVSACAKNESDIINTISSQNIENESSSEDAAAQAQKSTIEGYTYIDGREAPISISLEIENIVKGEEAYSQLWEQNPDIKQPDENEEYIIVTFNLSYNEGEKEELFMFENRASLQEAGLYFSLANNDSNASDMTSYLANSIYNISVAKGQSAQGAVAFLQEKGNTNPLCFVGFGKVCEFSIAEEISTAAVITALYGLPF